MQKRPASKLTALLSLPAQAVLQDRHFPCIASNLLGLCMFQIILHIYSMATDRAKKGGGGAR